MREKRQIADLAFLPKEITSHYITKKVLPSHFVSHSDIFSQSSFRSHFSFLHKFLLPQAPSSLEYIILGNRSNMKSWD